MSLRFIFWSLFSIGLLITALLLGTDVALFHPKGPVAGAQLNLMLISVVILLLVVGPTLIFLYAFAWKYRESNPTATYDPHPSHGKFFVFSLWALPSAFMFILALIMLPATRTLAPQRAIASNVRTLTIQVVAMRWKWLFIYPEQHIATVNFIQIPTNVPVQFVLSADETPMSSFWIPHLGGQLYAMTGHVNQLNLMADKPGDFRGSSAEINGAGFAGMKFITRASSQEKFDQWVQEVKLSSDILNTSAYAKLLQPSENNPVILYSSADAGLYDDLLQKYSGSHGHVMDHE